jgi:transcriptional regulator with XRE-family HTH domain
MKSLGERIRDAREAKQWTLEKLSSMSGVEVATISALETRKSERSKYAQPLAAALGISLDDASASQYMQQTQQPPLHVAEQPATYGSGRDAPWPFSSVTPSQWAAIPVPLRKKIEAYIQGALAASSP